MASKPEVGDTIRVYEDESVGREHVCTVRDLLDTQLTAVYEYARADGGWNERTLFVFYKDVQWNIAAREWRGRAG